MGQIIWRGYSDEVTARLRTAARRIGSTCRTKCLTVSDDRVLDPVSTDREESPRESTARDRWARAVQKEAEEGRRRVN
ncbi:hypothetical protein C8Q73DRAFT_698200 [Cubamyces lactineus]|nr:hypothetical protein C8Q73DRAFT_698200 [Cubamyces lactineus]